MARPKCVYIMQLDEVRYDHLSVYGYHRKQNYDHEPYITVIFMDYYATHL